MTRIPIDRRNVPMPITIPPWLTNPDMVAPCPCGLPIVAGMPYVVGEGETGMKRAFHQQCWAVMASGGLLEEGDDE